MDSDNGILYTRTSASATWIPVGGGSVDYPNFSWREGRDHMNRVTFDGYTNLDLYTTVGGGGVIVTASNDEFETHAVNCGEAAQPNNQTDGFYTNELTAWHTKNDNILSSTKLILEMRIKIIDRVASKKHWWGLFDQTLTTSTDINSTNRKIICAVDGTGNFFLRVADGTTENTVDTTIASDTSTHKIRLEWTSSQVEIFIDGTSRGTTSSNIPAEPLSIAGASRNATGGAADTQNYMDYWHYRVE